MVRALHLSSGWALHHEHWYQNDIYSQSVPPLLAIQTMAKNTCASIIGSATIYKLLVDRDLPVDLVNLREILLSGCHPGQLLERRRRPTRVLLKKVAYLKEGGLGLGIKDRIRGLPRGHRASCALVYEFERIRIDVD